MKTTITRVPGALPVLGHAVPLMRSPLDFLTSLSELGDVVEFRLGPLKAKLVADPGLTRQVLLNDRVFDKGGFLYDRAREFIGNGLISCPHGDHRRQRRLIQPAFRPDRFPAYTAVMSEHAAAVTAGWRDGQVLDVLAEMSAIAGRVTVATMFGAALDREVMDAAIGYFSDIVAGVYQQMLLPARLAALTPRGRRYDRACVRLRSTLTTLLAERRAGGAGQGDLLSLLLAEPESDDARMSDDEILDQMISFFMAGAETSAVVLSWAVYLVARHPGVERRLHAEVDAVLGGAAATFEDLPKLELAGQVITETLRLYPPGWILSRVTTADTELGPHFLPKGTILFYSPCLAQRRAEFHAEPARFDPDRWRGQDTARRTDFLPFGGGARKCIGDAFGLATTTITLATIASSWRLEPVRERPVRPALSATLRPRGLRMRAVRR